MTEADATKRAHELVDQLGKTTCVFAKTTTRKGEKHVDYIAGSAYEAPPRGYKLHTWVSVTGLERCAAGWEW